MRQLFSNDMVNDRKRYDTINDKKKRYDTINDKKDTTR